MNILIGKGVCGYYSLNVSLRAQACEPAVDGLDGRTAHAILQKFGTEERCAPCRPVHFPVPSCHCHCQACSVLNTLLDGRVGSCACRLRIITLTLAEKGTQTEAPVQEADTGFTGALMRPVEYAMRLSPVLLALCKSIFIAKGMLPCCSAQEETRGSDSACGCKHMARVLTSSTLVYMAGRRRGGGCGPAEGVLGAAGGPRGGRQGARAAAAGGDPAQAPRRLARGARCRDGPIKGLEEFLYGLMSGAHTSSAAEQTSERQSAVSFPAVGKPTGVRTVVAVRTSCEATPCGVGGCAGHAQG